MMTELLQLIAIIGVFYGSWKLDAIQRTLGQVLTILEYHKEDLATHDKDIKNHDERIARIERDGRTDPGPIRGGGLRIQTP
jgi:hypothetical protein